MSLEVLRRLGHTDAHQLFQKDGSMLSYTLEDLPLRGKGSNAGQCVPGIRVHAAVVEGLALGISDLEDRIWPGVTCPAEVLDNLIVAYVVFG